MSPMIQSRATLADVLAAVQTSPVTRRRRQDMASAVRTVAKVLGRDTIEIQADFRGLNARLKDASPTAAGISAARWNNVKSLFRSALALLGPMMKGRSTIPISEVWAGPYDTIKVRSDRIRLSRLMRWLSARQITPASIVAEDLEEFHQAISREALLRDPEATWVGVVRAWNRAVERQIGWPQLPISLESRANTFSLPWSTFPESLKHDVDKWLDRLAGRDFAEDGPSRPLGAHTLAAREYQLRAFASALVLRGRDPQSLVSLAACLTIENFVDGLRFFYDRLGQKPSATTHNLAAMLKSVARHWIGCDDDTLQRMTQITRKLSVVQSGLTPKNRDRLRPFNDLGNCQKLLSLPLVLRKEIERGKVPVHHRRVLGQVAVAVELLIFAPIRSKNLAALEIDRHLIKVGSKLMLTLPAVEVKNSTNLDFELPAPSADLIRWYLKEVRVAEPGNPALFPTAGGRHKGKNTLAIQITQTVRKYTGLAVNPHLFRHIAAQVYLSLNPGGYEVMRRVLGHKKMDTTTNFYAGLETISAARHFDQEILKLRDTGTRSELP